MTEENRRANAAADLRKARHALAAADELIRIALYDDAVSRLYYAAFHMASAALVACGIEATTHRGLMMLVSQHLVHPGLVSAVAARALSALFALRNQADYDRYFEIDEAGAREQRKHVTEIFAELEGFLRDRGLLADEAR